MRSERSEAESGGSSSPFFTPWLVTVLVLTVVTAVAGSLEGAELSSTVRDFLLTPVFMGWILGSLIGLVWKHRWIGPGMSLLLGAFLVVHGVGDWLDQRDAIRKLERFVPVMAAQVGDIATQYEAIRMRDAMHVFQPELQSLERQLDEVARLRARCAASMQQMFWSDYYESWLVGQGGLATNEVHGHPWKFLRLPEASALYRLMTAMNRQLDAEFRLLQRLVSHPLGWTRNPSGEFQFKPDGNPVYPASVREAERCMMEERAELAPLLERFRETYG